jgi:DNA-binding response OmpR family regulator
LLQVLIREPRAEGEPADAVRSLREMGVSATCAPCYLLLQDEGGPDMSGIDVLQQVRCGVVWCGVVW